MSVNILIGGAAGQGMDTISSILEKVLHRKGFWVFSHKDYMSRIRGGHNFMQVRFGNRPLHAHQEQLDLILALNTETVEIHRERLKPEGKILGDSALLFTGDEMISLPLEATAIKLGHTKLAGSIALGAILASFSLDQDKVEEVFREFFSGEILTINYQAFLAGAQLVGPMATVEKNGEDQGGRRIYINGNEALALGALAAGCTFYTGYPMTPSTGIMNYLAAKQREAGIIVEQAEDEIAAINMVIGASYAGARAMTATSGGGFSLMVESLGLAGMTETPLVVVEVQRPGPATGFPTRTEQSDLSFILTASHGEIPRMVLAVRDPQDAFYQAARAFNLSEKYQLPVLILSDQYLGDAGRSTEAFDFNKVAVERHLATADDLVPGEEYRRYRLTNNGISPRLIPGKVPGQVVLVDSDEHDEAGHITESAQVREAMMEKRLGKMKLLEQEVEEPELLGVPGQVIMVAWGSLYGPVKEAVEQLNSAGYQVGALVFGDLWPFPRQKLESLATENRVFINVEQNYTGQLARLIRQETSIVCTKSLLKYDGRPFGPEEICRRLKEEAL